MQTIVLKGAHLSLKEKTREFRNFFLPENQNSYLLESFFINKYFKFEKKKKIIYKLLNPIVGSTLR